MSRNNSLSGLTVQEIVAKVREFILKEQATKQLKKKVRIFPVVCAAYVSNHFIQHLLRTY